MTETRTDTSFAEAGAVTVHLDADDLAALETYITDRSETRSRPDAVLFILRDWLAGHGYLKPGETGNSSR